MKDNQYFVSIYGAWQSCFFGPIFNKYNKQRSNYGFSCYEVLSLCCESMPVFKNLKSLSIKSAENRGWQAMPVLLRNCPHLETLVLEVRITQFINLPNMYKISYFEFLIVTFMLSGSIAPCNR